MTYAWYVKKKKELCAPKSAKKSRPTRVKQSHVRKSQDLKKKKKKKVILKQGVDKLNSEWKQYTRLYTYIICG